jgi:hypothetical protein
MFLQKRRNLQQQQFSILGDTVPFCISQEGVNCVTKHNHTDLGYWSLKYTPPHVSVVQISYHQEGGGYTKRYTGERLIWTPETCCSV